MVKPIPDGYRTITPYLLVEGVTVLAEYLVNAFGAEEKCRLGRPNGGVMHMELRVGDSMIMMGEPNEAFGAMPSSIFLYVEDCDAVYERAIKAGGVSVMPVTDMRHAGERYGGVKDPTGNIWWIATHVEDLDIDEQKRRIAEMFDSAGS